MTSKDEAGPSKLWPIHGLDGAKAAFWSISACKLGCLRLRAQSDGADRCPSPAHFQAMATQLCHVRQSKQASGVQLLWGGKRTWEKCAGHISILDAHSEPSLQDRCTMSHTRTVKYACRMIAR